MKKLTILAVAALAISFASCSKDRVCTCVVTPTSGTATTEVTTYYKAKKKDARLMCMGHQEVDTNSGTTVTYSKYDCTLK